MKDVVYRNNVKFPDSGKIDFKIDGHPTVNITDEMDGEIYFLRVSSNVSKYIQYKDKMELIKPHKSNGLSKPSVVKVDHVLKEGFRNIWPAGTLADTDFKNVMKKLNEYRADNCCSDGYCACDDYDKIDQAEPSKS